MTAAAPFGLTPGQSRALSFIRSHIAQRRCAPSLDQIAAACGLASKSGAHRLVSALEERGHIRRLANRARTITLRETATMACSLPVSVALHARVAAEAHRLGWSIDRYVTETLLAALPEERESAPPRPWAS